MRPPLRIGLALGSLVVAVGMLLLAIDVLRWPGALSSGDVRFRVAPAAHLWKPGQLFPFDAGRALLGLDDQVAYRLGLQAFRRGKLRVAAYSNPQLVTQRARAQQQLSAYAAAAGNPVWRSGAANLVGALGFASAAIDPNDSSTYLQGSVDSFRYAIALDPDDNDAKYNLELALIRLKQAEVQTGTQPQGEDRGGKKRGAGNGQPGTGY